MRAIAVTLLIAAAVAVSACASSGAVPRPFPGAALPPTAAPATPPADAEDPPRADGTVPTSPPGPLTEPAVIQTALALRGTPYRNGGSDPAGFDCSGFVQWVFNRHGMRLPREVRDQFRVGRTVELAEVQPGDLLFFETVSRGASHVGVVLGGGEFIHAPSSRGVVRIERYGAEYWASRFIAARRVDAEILKTD